MICLFSSIKEIFTGQPLIPFQGGACKARKSVIVVPRTCLPDSNNCFYRTSIIYNYKANGNLIILIRFPLAFIDTLIRLFFLSLSAKFFTRK